MSYTTTPNLALRKPDPNDFYDVVAIFNFNADIIDQAIGSGGGSSPASPFKIVTSTTRPATPVPGMAIFETDTRRGYVYTTVWRQVFGPRAPYTMNYAATMIPDCALASKFRATLTNNAQIGVPLNPVDGQDIILELTGSGGAWVPSLITGVAGGFVFGSDVVSITAIVSGRTDVIGCSYVASINRWRVLSYSKGYTTT